MVHGVKENESKSITDNEIIKALECCKGKKKHCNSCPCMKNGTCFEVEEAALDLINRQQAELQRLQKQRNNAEELVCEKTTTITDLLYEIEKLKTENQILLRNAAEAFQEGLNENRALFEYEIKDEVIKDFAKYLIDQSKKVLY